MTIDSNFLQKAEKLYAPVMGTEEMAPLLYSLIRFSRPRTLLEIGAGYTTPFILKALADNKNDFETEKNILAKKERPLLDDYYKSDYNPRLLCIDNDSHPESTASKVIQTAKELDIEKYLDVVYGDFNGYTNHIKSEMKPFDFVWFDCGGIVEYTSFVGEYWQYINPDGGLLLLHSTMSNLVVNNFIKSIKLKQATNDFNNFEILSLMEPHKYSQNSVTLIRMTYQLTERFYTMNP